MIIQFKMEFYFIKEREKECCILIFNYLYMFLISGYITINNFEHFSVACISRTLRVRANSFVMLDTLPKN